MGSTEPETLSRRRLAFGERPYSDEVVTTVSEWMVLIAQPTRLRLLDRLELAGELHEQALVDGLSTTQQNVSRHLRLLLMAGVVSRRQDGRVAWYRLTNPDLLYPVHCVADTVRETDVETPGMLGE